MLPEWQDAAYLARNRWTGWKSSLARRMRPPKRPISRPMHPARARLAFDELLASQLAIALVRTTSAPCAGRATKGDGRLQQKALAALPFKLTPSQIFADRPRSRPTWQSPSAWCGCCRAMSAAARPWSPARHADAVEAGAQAALMAPTELLARQHYATIAPLAEAAGVEPGAAHRPRQPASRRRRRWQGLADGSIQLVVGTHALVQDDVEFADLALAVVDEQHRFGVHQRMALSSKGHGASICWS